MLNLKNVTILSINCVDPENSVKALLYSCKDIVFKEAVLFTDQNINRGGIRTITIPKLDSIHAYSDFVLRLSEYLDTDYVLIVQPDGFVVNARMWNPEWLLSDFIGAPWPMEQSWIERQQAKEYMGQWFQRVGNGGFSLRSRKFLELSANFHSCEGYGEDNFLCLVKGPYMRENGIQFAHTYEASIFSAENNMVDWQNPGTLDISKHFGFHGHNFSNSQEIINLKE